MKTSKLTAILLAFLCAAMLIVPVVSAVTNVQNPAAKETIVSLFTPVNNEVLSTANSVITNGKINMTAQYATEVSVRLEKKYQKNMDAIIDSLEATTGQKLAVNEREDLKQIIIQEHLTRVSWEQLKKTMGVKEEDFRTLTPATNAAALKTGVQPLSMPNSLILSQVSADVYGGIGVDGGYIPYIVNGGNSVYSVTYDPNYPGKILYEVHLYDEDVPSSYAADAAYDAFRLLYYGTITDTQGFFIYAPDSHGQRHIEFGNDWDNGDSYGTVVGQHGYNYLAWNPGTVIYISNVWNHAMGLTDRNSNMGKYNYFY